MVVAYLALHFYVMHAAVTVKKPLLVHIQRHPRDTVPLSSKSRPMIQNRESAFIHS